MLHKCRLLVLWLHRKALAGFGNKGNVFAVLQHVIAAPGFVGWPLRAIGISFDFPKPLGLCTIFKIQGQSAFLKNLFD